MRNFRRFLGKFIDFWKKAQSLHRKKSKIVLLRRMVCFVLRFVRFRKDFLKIFNFLQFLPFFTKFSPFHNFFTKNFPFCLHTLSHVSSLQLKIREKQRNLKKVENCGFLQISRVENFDLIEKAPFTRKRFCQWQNRDSKCQERFLFFRKISKF